MQKLEKHVALAPQWLAHALIWPTVAVNCGWTTASELRKVLSTCA